PRTQLSKQSTFAVAQVNIAEELGVEAAGDHQRRATYCHVQAPERFALAEPELGTQVAHAQRKKGRPTRHDRGQPGRRWRVPSCTRRPTSCGHLRMLDE